MIIESIGKILFTESSPASLTLLFRPESIPSSAVGTFISSLGGGAEPNSPIGGGPTRYVGDTVSRRQALHMLSVIAAHTQSQVVDKGAAAGDAVLGPCADLALVVIISQLGFEVAHRFCGHNGWFQAAAWLRGNVGATATNAAHLLSSR